MERPRELIPLQRAASALDQYHWEVEKDASGNFRKHSGNSGNSGTKATATTTVQSYSNTPKASAPAVTGKAPEARKAIEGSTPEYVKKLNPSGHLTQADRELRIAGGLCLYCGTKGHSVAACPLIPDKKRRLPAGTTGRAAVTVPDSIPIPELTATITEVIPEKV